MTRRLYLDPGKTHQAITLLHWWWPLACGQVLVDTVFTLGQQIRSVIALFDAHQLAHST